MVLHLYEQRDFAAVGRDREELDFVLGHPLFIAGLLQGAACAREEVPEDFAGEEARTLQRVDLHKR